MVDIHRQSKTHHQALLHTTLVQGSHMLNSTIHNLLHIRHAEEGNRESVKAKVLGVITNSKLPC